MTTRRTRGAPGALAIGCLLALLLVSPAVRAAEPDAPYDTADGWRKVVAYAHCAFLVFIAATPGDWAAAIFDCTRLYASESPAGAP